MLQGSPQRWTATSIFGSFFSFSALMSFSSSFDRSKFHVSGSISTKSICALQYNPQFDDETKVIAEVHNQSFSPRPSAKQAKCNADVALLTATEYLAPVYWQIEFSKRGTAVPCVRKSDLRIATQPFVELKFFLAIWMKIALPLFFLTGGQKYCIIAKKKLVS